MTIDLTFDTDLGNNMRWSVMDICRLEKIGLEI